MRLHVHCPSGINPSGFSWTQSKWLQKGSCALFGALPLLPIPQLVTDCCCQGAPFLSQHEHLHMSAQETWETESGATPGTWEENFAPQQEPQTWSQSDAAHPNSIASCNTYVYIWASKRKALRDEPVSILHTAAAYRSALVCKHTQEEEKISLQLTGRHGVIGNSFWDQIGPECKAGQVGMTSKKGPTEVCRPPGRLLWR